MIRSDDGHIYVKSKKYGTIFKVISYSDNMTKFMLEQIHPKTDSETPTILDGVPVKLIEYIHYRPMRHK